MIEKTGPTIYKGESIYKMGGGVNIVIPDDVKLFSVLKNTQQLNSSSVIILNGFSFNNENKYIGFCGRNNLSYRDDCETIFGQYNDNNIGPWIRTAFNYSDSAMFQWFNCGPNSTTVQLGTQIVNNDICPVVFNDKLIDFFTGNVYQTYPAGYAKKTINSIRVGNSGAPANFFNLYKIFVCDQKKKYLFNFYPAKKNNVVGMYDVINGLFCKPSLSGYWDVEGEIIY